MFRHLVFFTDIYCLFKSHTFLLDMFYKCTLQIWNFQSSTDISVLRYNCSKAHFHFSWPHIHPLSHFTCTKQWREVHKYLIHKLHFEFNSHFQESRRIQLIWGHIHSNFISPCTPKSCIDVGVLYRHFHLLIQFYTNRRKFEHCQNLQNKYLRLIKCGHSNYSFKSHQYPALELSSENIWKHLNGLSSIISLILFSELKIFIKFHLPSNASRYKLHICESSATYSTIILFSVSFDHVRPEHHGLAECEVSHLVQEYLMRIFLKPQLSNEHFSSTSYICSI